jgi:hypothetical protein
MQLYKGFRLRFGAFFVAGTVVGTVAGMLTLIYVLHTFQPHPQG